MAKAGERTAPGLCPSSNIVHPIYQCSPLTHSRRFIYADDICCALQVETFSEIQCTLTANLAHLAKYCQMWHLKPSTSKTVTSVFHLHNNRFRCELNVHMNGQRLKHDLYPMYLSVTLDQTLSYRERLSRSAAKLKSRNTTWLWNSQVPHWVPAQAPSAHQPWLFMLTIWNRADHYIFALWFLSSSFFFYSSPNLSRRRLDVVAWP